MIQVDAQDYREFSKQLRQAERGVKASIRRRIREAGKPLSEAVIREGAAPMPSRGGLRDRYQARGTARLSQTQSSLRMVLGRKGAYVGVPDRLGLVRHPVWGNREVWRSTKAPSGTWSRAFEDNKQVAVEVVSKVLDDVAKEIIR